MYDLKYRRQARNYLARLPHKIKSKIVEKLHELKDNPDDPNLDIDRLKGSLGYRLRVGQYRIIYTRYDNELIIEVVKIRPRGVACLDAAKVGGLQSQGVKGEAVSLYRKSLTTQDMKSSNFPGG